MAKVETTVTLEELLVSSLAQTDALAKPLIERHHHATGISREDFRRAGDISGDVKANVTLTDTKQITLNRRLAG
jgi:hypothetical protein